MNPTIDQLVTAARLLTEQNAHGITVREYDGKMLFNGQHVLTINAATMFRIDPDGSVVS